MKGDGEDRLSVISAKLANEVTQIPPSGEGLEGIELVEAAPHAPGESHSFLEGFEQERIHTGL